MGRSPTTQPGPASRGLAHLLTAEMEAQERNFAWVARHSGLSPATVARLLRAERAMSVEQFVDMAGAAQGFHMPRDASD